MTPGEALTGALTTLYERASVVDRMTYTQAAETFGGNGPLAASIAGTTDKGSNEYKTAIRTVQRYIKGERGEGGQTRGTKKPPLLSIRRFGRAVVNQHMRRDGVTVAGVAATLTISSDVSERDIGTVVELGPGAAGAVLDLMDAGDADAAAATFFDNWGDEYGLPMHVGVGVDNVTRIALALD